jgi:phosphonopyruvate decarboxylase
MIDPSAALEVLLRAEVDLFTGVPDSLLKEFNSCVVGQLGPDSHVVAPNEGAAVALAAGHFLASGRPALVYLQNSGLGNAVNPLLSLTSGEVFGIPMILMIGWRGEPGTSDEPQHRHQGRITEDMLGLLDIPVHKLGPDSVEWQSILESAVEVALDTSRPTAVVVSAGTFSPYEGPSESRGQSGPLRVEAIETVLDTLHDDTFYVATTGYTARELGFARHKRGEPEDHDLLVVGSMGHAMSIALGIALARPEAAVVCLDGDGSLAMHLGAMAMIGQRQPPNLGHVLLDNGMHESVGGQPSALSDADPAGIARACGYAAVGSCNDLDGLAGALNEATAGPGPWFVQVKLGRGTIPGLPRPDNLMQRSRRLMGALEA